MEIKQNTSEERLREVNRQLAAPGSNVIMGPHKVVHTLGGSDLQVETQDVEVWTPGVGKATLRFTTYRCRKTGKPVIANVDVVDDMETGK